jgi:beta-glucosidase
VTGNSSERIERLLAQMTIEEKVGQLNMLTAGLAVTGPSDPANCTAELRAGLQACSTLGNIGNRQTRQRLPSAWVIAAPGQRKCIR